MTRTINSPTVSFFPHDEVNNTLEPRYSKLELSKEIKKGSSNWEFTLSRVKLITNDLKGKRIYFELAGIDVIELAGGSSYRE